MSKGFIRTIKNALGQSILPKTVSEAVYCDDGSTVKDKITNIDTEITNINNKENVINRVILKGKSDCYSATINNLVNYYDGLAILVKIPQTNTGTVMVSCNSLESKPLKCKSGNSYTFLSPGVVTENCWYMIVYSENINAFVVNSISENVIVSDGKQSLSNKTLTNCDANTTNIGDSSSNIATTAFVQLIKNAIINAFPKSLPANGGNADSVDNISGNVIKTHLQDVSSHLSTEQVKKISNIGNISIGDINRDITYLPMEFDLSLTNELFPNYKYKDKYYLLKNNILYIMTFNQITYKFDIIKQYNITVKAGGSADSLVPFDLITIINDDYLIIIVSRKYDSYSYWQYGLKVNLVDGTQILITNLNEDASIALRSGDGRCVQPLSGGHKIYYPFDAERGYQIYNFDTLNFEGSFNTYDKFGERIDWKCYVDGYIFYVGENDKILKRREVNNFDNKVTFGYIDYSYYPTPITYKGQKVLYEIRTVDVYQNRFNLWLTDLNNNILFTKEFNFNFGNGNIYGIKTILDDRYFIIHSTEETVIIDMVLNNLVYVNTNNRFLSQVQVSQNTRPSTRIYTNNNIISVGLSKYSKSDMTLITQLPIKDTAEITNASFIQNMYISNDVVAIVDINSNRLFNVFKIQYTSIY